MAETKILRLRTTRVQIAIPVFIYGNNESGPPFREISETALGECQWLPRLRLPRPLSKNSPFLLTNIKTNEDMQCTVVTLGNFVNGKTEVGLRFGQPSPRFWGIGFPPEDWDPAERKRHVPSKR